MKQTAVQQLRTKIWALSIQALNDSDIDIYDFKQRYNKLMEEMEQLERQQIIDAYSTVITKYNGIKSWTKIHDEEAETYYRENYELC